ncbi:MAG: rubrerythrin family protein [Salinivirgaceae bacterium]|jgi:rubrerythrin|nr:rubrerythrin family protein [Salinivirgaceae bacterium]
MSIKGTQTEQNLLKAFAGESQVKNRYEFFAKVAKKEGYEQISALFIKTASQEQSHAKTIFKYLEGGVVEITATYPAPKIGATIENLEAAALGENEEHTELYPEFAKVATKEGFKEISAIFKIIGKIEAVHERRFKKMFDNLNADQVFKREKSQKWECRKCGHIHEGKTAPKICPACRHPQGYFEIEAENY